MSKKRYGRVIFSISYPVCLDDGNIDQAIDLLREFLWLPRDITDAERFLNYVRVEGDPKMDEKDIPKHYYNPDR